MKFFLTESKTISEDQKKCAHAFIEEKSDDMFISEKCSKCNLFRVAERGITQQLADKICAEYSEREHHFLDDIKKKYAPEWEYFTSEDLKNMFREPEREINS